jgi:hypothetical protein
MLKFHIDPMLKALRDLQGYCELILYTFLPKEFLELLLEKVSGLKNCFSYIFSGSDLIEADNYFVKDLSKLIVSR